MSVSSPADRAPVSWISSWLLPLASFSASLGALSALSVLPGEWTEPTAWGASGLALVLGALGARGRSAGAVAVLLFALTVALLLLAVRV